MSELEYRLREFLKANGFFDFELILSEMYKKNLMSFVSFVHQISEGYGLITSEETGFGLENDYDFPDEFSSIDFFIGGCESSSMSFLEFIGALEGLCDIYIFFHPEDNDIIKKHLNAIRLKYQNF
ncbi:hypothetical protein [Moraxella bovis]|uniref:CDI immunity protein domain-containing protein n=1 Tax=Moraxella bovis TaxID=476 RepID=A0A378PTG2_MORBO|nr:hypothetical protein [Moraxella bovis]STY88597.1 Uncharacterised protein [Moraxella bovis]